MFIKEKFLLFSFSYRFICKTKFHFIFVLFVNSSTYVNDQASQSLEALSFLFYWRSYPNQFVTILFLEPFEGKGNKFVVFYFLGSAW